MKRWNLTIAATAALVAGCVPVPRPVSLPDGSTGYSVRCHRDIGNCMNEAAQVCGGKYQILDRDGDVIGSAVMPAGNGAIVARGIRKTLIVRCGAP